MTTACTPRKADATRETPAVVAEYQPAACESAAWPYGMGERFVVPMKPGNAGGGKEPQLEANATSKAGREIGAMSQITPVRVQKLQTALHGKAKESPRHRFHAL